MLPIGPLLPPAYLSTEAVGSSSNSTTEDRDHCLRWLDSQPEGSVVFVSFGSVSSLRDKQITALATGLADSGHKFLYVCRPPAQWDGRDPIDKSLAPSEYLPDGYEGRIEGQGYLVRGWAPQLEILSHPAVGGFLTHCGWNSVLESLCRAVPLLAWPLQAEQRMNCRFVTIFSSKFKHILCTLPIIAVSFSPYFYVWFLSSSKPVHAGEEVIFGNRYHDHKIVHLCFQ